MSGVRVKKLPSKCTEKGIKIHFAKPENGGGPIKEIYFPLFKNDAVIIFENLVTAETVVENEKHYIQGEEVLVEHLPFTQAFTIMEAHFDPSVAALIQANEDIRDEIQYHKNADLRYDEMGCIIGVRGNWYLLEWVWAYIEQISRRQRETRQYRNRTVPNALEQTRPKISSPKKLERPLISMPTATDNNADIKDQSSGTGKKGKSSADGKVKMKASEKSARTVCDTEKGTKEIDSSDKAETGKTAILDDDKSIERFTAFTISDTEKIVNEIKILSDKADDIRSLDFRYGPLSVCVYTGLITMAETDAIVNAANGCLAHVGGIADAIAKAAGPEMQRQCETYIRNFGNVPSTSVIHTCAGGRISLNVKYIMHAVGPMFLSTRPEKSASELSRTFLNCMIYANDVLKIKSVAMPVISSGIFGCPLEICIRSFFNAVLLFASDHLTDSVHLREVHLVNNDSDKTALTVLQLRELIPEGTEKFVLEAQQQVQQNDTEDDDYTIRRDASRRLDFVREPTTSESKYRFTSGIDVSSDLTHERLSFGDGDSPVAEGLSYTRDNRFPGLGTSNPLHGERWNTLTSGANVYPVEADDIRKNAYTRRDQWSGTEAFSLGTDRSKSYGLTSRDADTLSPPTSTTRYSSSSNRNLSDTRETGSDVSSRNRKSGPPTTSYMYSQQLGFAGISREYDTAGFSSGLPKTAGRPLPQPPTVNSRANRY